MKKSLLITIIAILLVGLVGGGYFVLRTPGGVQALMGNAPTAQGVSGGQAQTTSTTATTGVDGTAATVTIRSTEGVIGKVTTAGNIELSSRIHVGLKVSGVVAEVGVQVGDTVSAGDLLVALDSADLEVALARSTLSLQSAQSQWDDLTAEASASDIAVAQADLTQAQENLVDAQTGPSAQEIAAARSSLSSAWARYNELKAGPSQDELTQLSANLEKADIAVQEARRAYEQISWRNDVGMTPQAATLQQATIDYNSALAAYNVSTASAATSDLQSAISSAQSAQDKLDQLLSEPTPATVAQAEAAVVSAQAKLDDLVKGADQVSLDTARINLEKAQLDLVDAQTNLANARVIAPVDGTVLSVNLEVGERGSSGQEVVRLADTTKLELTVNVAEVDISRLAVGQSAQVAIDALPGRTFDGTVSQIAPSSESQSGVVNYPVTIRLTDADLSGVRAGMTAVATVSEGTATQGWLVPTTAIQQSDGGALVMVVRSGVSSQVAVTTGEVQGEWTVVQSAELTTGDQVVGNLTTLVNAASDSSSSLFPGPGGGGPRP